MRLGKAVLGGIAASLLLAGGAMAADVPPIAPIAPPAPPMAAEHSWGGAYAGVFAENIITFNGTGIFGLGALVGFNVDTGTVVMGVEARLATEPGPFAFRSAMATARIGADLGRVLPYATAGVGTFLFGPSFFWLAGAGVEVVAFGDAVSLRTELTYRSFFGACCPSLHMTVGTNFYFGK